MAPAIYWEGTDITEYVTSYRRDDNLCNSTSLIELVLSGNCPHAFDFYDAIVLYEDGNKKGTYKINNKSESYPNYEINITATNSQINLENYFITDRYYIVDTPLLKTRYWLEKFLDESDVSYNFTTTGDGEFLPEDIVLGGNIAIDEVRRLLQYSGWYLRYDENGTAQIGNLEYNSDYYSVSISDSTIIDIHTVENDAFLRNRAVVWGMGSLDSESNGWIFADISTQTPWNYDANDLRAVVVSNSYIADYATALSIAQKLLTEFTKPNYVKTVRIAGFVDTFVGDRVRINSSYLGAICTVTTINVEFAEGGQITTLTLDERCPRMIGYFNYGGYVYVGTEDYGIWRKPLKYDHTWQQDSIGLGNIHVTDLSIHAGLFSCVAEDELYIRSPETTTWTKITPYILESGILVSDAVCTATSVHRSQNIVQSLFTYPNSISGYGFSPSITRANPRSWLLETLPNGVSVSYPVTISGSYDYVATSIDNNGKDAYIAALTSASGIMEIPGGFHMTQAIGSAEDVTIRASKIYNIDTSYNSAIDILQTNRTIIPDDAVGFSVAYGDYIYYNLSSDYKTIYKYNYITETYSSVACSHNIYNFIVYNEDLIIGTKMDWDAATYGYYSFYYAIVDFSTGVATRYLLDALSTSGAYSEEVQLTYGIIINDVVIFTYVCRNFYAKSFNLNTLILSDRVEIIHGFTAHPDELIFLRNSSYNFEYNFGAIVDDRWFSAFRYGTRYTAPYNFRYGTFTIDEYLQFYITFGFEQTTTVDFPDFDNHHAVGMYSTTPCIIDYNSTVSLYSSAVLPAGGSWVAACKDYTYYTESSNMYDSNGVSLIMPDISSLTSPIISKVADDGDDGLIYYDYINGKVHKVILGRYLVEESITEILTDVFAGYAATPRLFGERLAIASNIFYANTTDERGVGGTSYRILKFSNGTFEDVGYTSTLLVIEASKPSPVTLYGGYETLNGAQLYTNLTDEFNQVLLPDENFILDLRVVDTMLDGSYQRYLMYLAGPTASGYTLVKTLNLIPDSEGVYERAIFTPSLASGVSISGMFNHLETTNTQNIPYMFFSISGVPPVFYQLTGGDLGDVSITDFEEHSAGLPSSPITCIRADDLI